MGAFVRSYWKHMDPPVVLNYISSTLRQTPFFHSFLFAGEELLGSKYNELLTRQQPDSSYLMSSARPVLACDTKVAIISTCIRKTNSFLPRAHRFPVLSTSFPNRMLQNIATVVYLCQNPICEYVSRREKLVPSVCRRRKRRQLK